MAAGGPDRSVTRGNDDHGRIDQLVLYVVLFPDIAIHRLRHDNPGFGQEPAPAGCVLTLKVQTVIAQTSCAAVLDATEAPVYVANPQGTDIDTDPTGVVRIGLSPYHNVGFIGLIDDVRIYGRALSNGEIAWLGGKRDPMHKPF